MKDKVVYQIKYSYQTGNSFGSEDMDGILEYEWEDLNNAKDALKRINQHYKWYQGQRYSYMEKTPKPKWLKISGQYMSDECINLKMDNGKEIQFWCPWCGYFESLYGAEIIQIPDNDMSFKIK
jgi:hypothetical protein